MSCCYGWRIRSYATNGRAAPTRNAAPPAVKAAWSRHPKAVVVVLVLQRRVMRKHAQVFFFSYGPLIMGDSHSFVASFKIRPRVTL